MSTMKLLGLGVATLLLSSLPCACGDDVDDPGGDPAQCTTYDNEPEEQVVAVTIRNDTSEPLFLSNGNSCSTHLTLMVTDPDGNDRSWRHGGLCSFTCEDLQEHGPDCPTVCPMPPIIYLEPGGSYTETWTGLVHERLTMPESCFVDPLGDNGCNQLVVASAGSYTITARAWSAVAQCSDLSCLCTPDAAGSCTVDSAQAVEPGTERDVSATVDYPSESTLEIVFD